MYTSPEMHLGRWEQYHLFHPRGETCCRSADILMDVPWSRKEPGSNTSVRWETNSAHPLQEGVMVS